MSPLAERLKPVAVMMMSASSSLPDFSRMPFSVKRSISSVTTEALPDLMPWNKSPSGMKAIGLPHRRVFWLEVGCVAVVLAEIGFDRRQQILLRSLGLLKGLAGEGALIEQDFAPRDFVDPFLVDLQLAQLLGDLDGVAAGAEIGRRTLQ